MSNEIENKCIKNGVRLTEQRKLVAKIMSESDDHPDVDELHKRISKVDSKISIPAPNCDSFCKCEKCQDEALPFIAEY